jgi:thiamine-phosphate pyrophosphorylase
LVDRLIAAADAGAALIQVRERLLSDRDLLAFTRELVDRARESACRVMVNDRLDVALAAGAHGVHLKSDGPAGPDVRRLTPPGFLVGRSIHTADEATACNQAGGYDYLLFGTVFRSDSKPDGHQPSGVEALARACAATRLPVLAIGGIDADRASAVARAGAAGMAAISTFATAPDIAAEVRRVRDALTLPERSVYSGGGQE